MKILQILRLFTACFLLFPLIGCVPPKMLFDKPGLTNEELNRDKYECVQQSRTSWAGGGFGSVGLISIIAAKSSADQEAHNLFKMCMEARGYTTREVSDEEFDKQKASPLKIELNEIAKDINNICNKNDFNLIFIKSACRVEKITLEQLSDKSMILENEKTTFSQYRSEVKDKNNKLFELIRTYGDSKEKEFGLAGERFYLQTEQNALDLFEGKITWGEYNKKRKELFQTLQIERNSIFNKN